VRTNLKFINSELSPNKCKFGFINLKVIQKISNCEFRTKHEKYKNLPHFFTIEKSKNLQHFLRNCIPKSYVELKEKKKLYQNKLNINYKSEIANCKFAN